MNQLYRELQKLIILRPVITFFLIQPLPLYFYHFCLTTLKKITPYLSSFNSLMSARVLDAPFFPLMQSTFLFVHKNDGVQAISCRKSYENCIFPSEPKFLTCELTG